MVAGVGHRRGISAFEKLNVPVLGVVENMAGDIFGNGGGEKAADELDLAFLGRIGLDADIRRGGDEGRPFVLDGDHPQSGDFRRLARVVAGRISQLRVGAA